MTTILTVETRHSNLLAARRILNNALALNISVRGQLRLAYEANKDSTARETYLQGILDNADQMRDEAVTALNAIDFTYHNDVKPYTDLSYFAAQVKWSYDFAGGTTIHPGAVRLYTATGTPWDVFDAGDKVQIVSAEDVESLGVYVVGAVNVGNAAILLWRVDYTSVMTTADNDADSLVRVIHTEHPWAGYVSAEAGGSYTTATLVWSGGGPYTLTVEADGGTPFSVFGVGDTVFLQDPQDAANGGIFTVVTQSDTDLTFSRATTGANNVNDTTLYIGLLEAA